MTPEPDPLRGYALAWIAEQKRPDGTNWSLAELGRHLGIDKGTVSRMFSGESEYARRDYFPKIASFLGISLHDLYDGALRLWERTEGPMTRAVNLSLKPNQYRHIADDADPTDTTGIVIHEDRLYRDGEEFGRMVHRHSRHDAGYEILDPGDIEISYIPTGKELK